MSELGTTTITELSLEGFSDSKYAVIDAKVEALVKEPPAEIDDSMLNEREKMVVKEFVQKIDVRDSGLVMSYGAEAQKKISGFSETALNKVRTKDMGEVGDMLTGLVAELKSIDMDEEPPKGIKKLFNKAGSTIMNMKGRFETAEKSVNRISGMLEDHKVQLIRDISMMDEMYDRNLGYYKELTMYILAGQEKLKQIREKELPELRTKALETNLPEDAQAANDLEGQCNRFEKKIHDLDLSRMVSIQMAPQIRMVQSNDVMMAEKIQSSLTNTIPLWKNQMVLALGIEHSRQAMEAQRAVSDMTNELLKKNADTLKQGSIDIARESERGIVDIETLQYTNAALISTLDEVMNIQQQGRQKRAEAELELKRIEGELKSKLLESTGNIA